VDAREKNETLGQATIILITDGLADILPDTAALVLRTGAPLHTIQVSRDRNPGLERISDSFTTLAGLPDLLEAAPES
jgi:uncharacterized protein with von Willebrand factor type A (vWA) domain